MQFWSKLWAVTFATAWHQLEMMVKNDRHMLVHQAHDLLKDLLERKLCLGVFYMFLWDLSQFWRVYRHPVSWILPSCTAAAWGGRAWGAPGHTSPPGSPPTSGCDTPLTGTALQLSPTPPPSRPSVAPPPAGAGSAARHGGGARERRSLLKHRALRACLWRWRRWTLERLAI